MAHYKTEQEDWLLAHLKYLLFIFNFFFWLGGAAVMTVGVWTLVEKSGYLSILASSTFTASAYILIFSGALVLATGFLGFGAIIREQKSCLSTGVKTGSRGRNLEAGTEAETTEEHCLGAYFPWLAQFPVFYSPGPSP